MAALPNRRVSKEEVPSFNRKSRPPHQYPPPHAGTHWHCSTYYVSCIHDDCDQKSVGGGITEAYKQQRVKEKKEKDGACYACGETDLVWWESWAAVGVLGLRLGAERHPSEGKNQQGL